jgi:hypothetical protein
VLFLPWLLSRWVKGTGCIFICKQALTRWIAENRNVFLIIGIIKRALLKILKHRQYRLKDYLG